MVQFPAKIMSWDFDERCYDAAILLIVLVILIDQYNWALWHCSIASHLVETNIKFSWIILAGNWILGWIVMLWLVFFIACHWIFKIFYTAACWQSKNRIILRILNIFFNKQTAWAERLKTAKRSEKVRRFIFITVYIYF